MKDALTPRRLIAIGRDEDVILAGITTAVVLVASAVSPHDAWQQPILRLADTAVGIAVGVSVSWVTLQLPARLGIEARVFTGANAGSPRDRGLASTTDRRRTSA